MNKLLILGAGGHGKVVADAAKSIGEWDEIAFLDDEFENMHECESFPVIAALNDFDDLVSNYNDCIVAIGNNTCRIDYLEKLKIKNIKIPVIVHPSSVVSDSSCIQPGTVIVAGSVINPNVEVGFGCIINTGVTVDHDCVLEDGVHLSPGVNLGGNVKIGKNSWIGIGATVKNNIDIGANVIVGAGSVVVNDITDSSTVIGVPAKPCVK